MQLAGHAADACAVACVNALGVFILRTCQLARPGYFLHYGATKKCGRNFGIPIFFTDFQSITDLGRRVSATELLFKIFSRWGRSRVP